MNDKEFLKEVESGDIEIAKCGGKGDCCCNPESIQPTSYDENTVRELAYFRWLAATNGNPVDSQQSDNFWLEAENEVKSQCN